MSVVTTIVLFTGLLLMAVPLVFVVVCALRRAGRKVDRILREELSPQTPGTECGAAEENPPRNRP